MAEYLRTGSTSIAGAASARWRMPIPSLSSWKTQDWYCHTSCVLYTWPRA